MRKYARRIVSAILLGAVGLVFMLELTPAQQVVEREPVEATVHFEKTVGGKMQVEHEGLTESFPATEFARDEDARKGTISVCLVTYESGEAGLHRYC